MRTILSVIPVLASVWICSQLNLQSAPGPILFNTQFEGGSLGKIEHVAENHYRCFVQGQYDERGHNRQASWYYFRMNNVKDRDVTLVLTDFVGEYNDKPGAVPMNADNLPVFSYDQTQWEHFSRMQWDDQTKEATLQFRPREQTIWIARQPPYTLSRLTELLREIDQSPSALVEVIGQTVQGRNLRLVTVTELVPGTNDKPCVWLMARQHGWESATSFVMEGALRFIASDDPQAQSWRRKVVFKFVPAMDPDGLVHGHVRFNANGYDLNRHWSELKFEHKEDLQRMPEIWYVKKAIFNLLNAGMDLRLMVNLHNTESGEFLETQATNAAVVAVMKQLHALLAANTSFDPSHELRIRPSEGTDTNSLFRERQVPVLLMEQRTGTSPKLCRRLTVEDRLAFGRALIEAMAKSVLD